MSRTKVGLVGIAAAAILALSATPSGAAEPTVALETLQVGNGWSWTSPTTTTTIVHPPQVSTESRDLAPTIDTRTKATETVTRTNGSAYSSQVQQPINPDGTSTWPAKRGVIPVQFKLTKADVTEQATKTTTESQSCVPHETRTKTVTSQTTSKTPSFVSIGTDDNPVNDWSALGWTGPTWLQVKHIDQLRADFSWLEGSSHGGSLRWSIRLADSRTVNVYYGDEPDWTGTGGSGVNLYAEPGLRFDTSQVGGTFYDTKAHMLELVGDAYVERISLVVDSAWQHTDQRLQLGFVGVAFNTNALVGWFAYNHNTIPQLSSSSQTSYSDWTSTEPTCGPWTENAPTYSAWVPIGTSNPVQTNEPPAFIRVERQATDTTPLDVIEELSSAQGDTTGAFRQIDGKYMYNLKAETLQKGSFKVYMVIDGQKVLTNPGVFELR